MAYESLEPHKVIAFARNVDHIGQQKKSRLLNHVMADLAFGEKGDRFTDNLMGLSEPEETFSDFGDTPEDDVEKYTRWAAFRTWHDSVRIGTREMAEQLVDPRNPKVQAMGFGRERRRDKSIIEGMMVNPMYSSGNDGAISSISFPSGTQDIAHDFNTLWKGKADGDAAPNSAPTVLTPQKLRQALNVLDDSNIDGDDMPRIAVEQRDLTNLLTSVEVTSADYNNVKALVNGEIDTFMGFKFVKVAKGTLPLVSGETTQWLLPVWYKSQILYKERPLVGTRVTERPDKQYNWYAYYKYQDAVLRRQDTAVVRIEVTR